MGELTNALQGKLNSRKGQVKDPAEKQGAYWQISYTHRMRSRSEYVRPEHLPAVRAELANFRKFRRLTERWIDLSLEVSRLKRKTPQPKEK